MGTIWDGIPTELRPEKADVGLLEAILWKVIEARAIYRDFDHAKSLRAGQRRLSNVWESDFVRTGGLLTRFYLVTLAPVREWNARIHLVESHAALLVRGIKSPWLRSFLLEKVHRLFYTYIEDDGILRLSRDPLAGWFVPGRPDRLIRYLRHERPR